MWGVNFPGGKIRKMVFHYKFEWNMSNSGTYGLYCLVCRRLKDSTLLLYFVLTNGYSKEHLEKWCFLRDLVSLLFETFLKFLRHVQLSIMWLCLWGDLTVFELLSNGLKYIHLWHFCYLSQVFVSDVTGEQMPVSSASPKKFIKWMH